MRYQIHEGLSQSRSNVAFGRLLEWHRLFEQSRGQVISQLRDLLGHGLVCLPVFLGEERQELLTHGAGIRAEKQIATVRCGQEVMGIPTNELEPDSKLG